MPDKPPPGLAWATKRLAILVFAALLVAYGASRVGVFEWPRRYDPLAVPDLGETPGLLTHWQMKLVDAEASNCVAALNRAGQPAALKATQANAMGCSREATIDLSRLSQASLRAEETRCAIAARLYMWERHVLQPLAKRSFGQPVREILHFGSYNCRMKRGGSTLSEHASANAFDISGFKLADGTTISVLKDWPKQDAKARFLRAARDGLCQWFNVTLSPDYNADHANHFHVDMGWYRTCR